jgi:hypothetical protein
MALAEVLVELAEFANSLHALLMQTGVIRGCECECGVDFSGDGHSQ